MSSQRNWLFYSLFSKGLKFSFTSKIDPDYNLDFLPLFLAGFRHTNYPKLMKILNKISSERVANLFTISFYIRCPRTGRGERLVGRYLFQWLMINYPLEFRNHFRKIPEFGRWDDLFCLFPGFLKLDNLNFVRKNYISEIDKKKLLDVRKTQLIVVRYVADKILESFRIFMSGQRGFELFVKWLPSETSSLNKKGHIVETLCKVLRISLHDYRVIYISPMRKSLNICETKMCEGSWRSLNYEKMGKKAIKKYKKALRRRDKDRFSLWKRKKSLSLRRQTSKSC